MKRYRWIALLLALVFVLAVLAGCGDAGIVKPHSDDDGSRSSGDNGDRPAPSSGDKNPLAGLDPVDFETYDNSLVSLEIPKGWQVEVAPADYIHYSFKVFDPANKNRMLLFSLKLEGFLKSQGARDWYRNTYPDSAFARLPAIDPQTTEAFFGVWSETAEVCNTYDLNGYAYFPKLNGFTVEGNFGRQYLNGDLLYASCRSETGEALRGIFTTSVMSAGSYNMYGYDFAPLMTYHTILLTAPDAEFNSWLPALDHSLSTLQFSQKFVDGFMEQEGNLVATIQANQKVYDAISEIIMNAWNERF